MLRPPDNLLKIEYFTPSLHYRPKYAKIKKARKLFYKMVHFVKEFI